VGLGRLWSGYSVGISSLQGGEDVKGRRASEALWPEKFDTIQDSTVKLIRIAFLGI
jgi:hypothetical protein